MNDKRVYAFGHVSTGRIHRIEGSFPEANGYGEVQETLKNYSGEATGTSLVLQRLGIQTTLEGNWIGDNPQGKETLDFLTGRGIDTSGLHIQEGYEGVNEIVITDGKTRTVFGRYIDLLFTTPQWEAPSEEAIQKASLVSIDASFGSTADQVGRLAQKHNIPFVSIDAPYDSWLTQNAQVMILSEEFLKRVYKDELEQDKLEELFVHYLENCPGWVVFTFGENPLWFAKKNPLFKQEFKPFQIDPLDTAGAGDSFRGGLLYGMLQEGWSFAESIRFAAGVAAMVCLSTPGACDSPSVSEVEEFLSLYDFINKD